METIYIGESKYFKQPDKLEQLNMFVQSAQKFKPQDMSSATGCPPADALYIGVRLFLLYLAEGYLLIYQDGLKIAERKFSEGFMGGDYKYQFEFLMYNNDVVFTTCEPTE